LLDAYQAEVIELAELAERRERLTAQGQQLRARVQEIAQQRQDRAAELRLLEGVEAFCASIRDAMVAPSFEVKQKVLQLVVQRIVVEDHRITIEHVVPSGPLRLQTEHHLNKKLRFCIIPYLTALCVVVNMSFSRTGETTHEA
jgi:site-specific DNA recombinase